MNDGGYDRGYATCPCFWGRQPSSLIASFLSAHPNLSDWTVLDAGCGEGKNAVKMAEHGAKVVAVDCSALALKNASAAWPANSVRWVHADITAVPLREKFDLVVAYGLPHCLNDAHTADRTLRKLQTATRPGGYHVLCAFNSRYQDIDKAHPGFRPFLATHDWYLAIYDGWEIQLATDTDLREIHPDTQIEHVHSMTRIVARRPL